MYCWRLRGVRSNQSNPPPPPRYGPDEDVIHTASGWLEDQDKEFFYSGIQGVEKRWDKFISVGGDYVKE